MNRIREIWSLITFRPALYLASVIFASLLFYALPVLPGLILQHAFGALTAHNPDLRHYELFAALIFGVGVLWMFKSTSGSWAETGSMMSITILLRRNMLEHFLRTPGVELPPGDVVSRFRSDVDAISTFVVWIPDILGQIGLTAFIFMVLLLIDAVFTLAVIVPLLISLSVVQASASRIVRVRTRLQEDTGEVTNFLGNILGAALAVKVAGAEDRVGRYFESLNARRGNAAVNDATLEAVLNAISFNMGGIASGVLLILVAGQMRAGRFSVGDLALFVSYMTVLTITSRWAGKVLAYFKQAGVSLGRLHAAMKGSRPGALVARNPIHVSGPFPEYHPLRRSPDALTLVQARNLTYYFPNSGSGVEDISLTIPAGSFTVVTGRIGAGKTTLLRTLLGLLPKHSGEVKWNGTTVEEQSAFFVAPRVAYTPQSPHLFSESLRDNILLGMSDEDGRLQSAIACAALSYDVARMSDGVNTLIGPRGVRLSGGQVQRAAVARMIMRDADLLVLDDVSSALDVATERELWGKLHELRRKTYLVVSHRRDTLLRADQIVVMDGGRVVASGTLTEVLERSPVMRELWESAT